MNHRTVLGVLCAATLVGAPWASVEPALAQNEPGGSFRALSYNVAGLTEPISGSEPATNSALISPLLNDYDLVLLQEDWADPVEEEERLQRPDERVPPLFYHHLIVSKAQHPFQSEPAPHPWGADLRRAPAGPTLISDGLNRLSWFPFGKLERVMWRTCFGDLALEVAEEALALTGREDEELQDLGVTGPYGVVDGGSSDCGAQKGFSVASTELVPGVWVDVYNHHADAGSHERDLEARADNFEQLADFILEYSEGRAVILGGDTNLKFDSGRRESQQEIDGGTWETFQEVTGLTDVCEAIDCGDMDELRAEGFKVHDRFAFRSGGGVELTPVSHDFERAKFTRDDGEPLSDHDPVAVTFEWRLLE